MRHLDLYPHNQKAYIELEKMLAENGRAAIIHPTGTGKSYIAFALALTHRNKHILWFAPNECIFNHQTDKLWRKNHIRLSNVEFHTYAWLVWNEDTMEELRPDFIILDEFHRAGAVEWGKSINKLLDMYPEAKVVGFSATNIRYLDNKRDMAIELFNGHIASEMSLCEAMVKGILPTPKYVITIFPYKEKITQYETRLSKLINTEQKKRTEKLIRKFKRAMQFATGMDEIFKKHLPGKSCKLIIFCTHSEHMMEIIARAPEWFGKIDPNPHVYSVHSNNTEAVKIFERFVEDDSSHLKLLYCVDMLNEGIHVDGVDAVVLCRPTISPIVYKQQIGRAIGAGATKTPVIFDMVNNFDGLYNIDSFQKELEQTVLMYGNTPGDIYGDMEQFEIIDELKDCREILEEIQRNLDSPWETYYQEYRNYIEKKGTTDIPRRYINENGLRLGKWVDRQRSKYNDNKLSGLKAKLLEEIGMEWKPVKDRRFDRWIRLLTQYREEHGDSQVPYKYQTESGDKLGFWCYNVRNKYKIGEISEERIRKLEELGFSWDANDYYWNEGYEHVRTYHDKFGNIYIPKKYVCEDGYRLGNWISTQRSVRKGTIPGSLDDEKIAKLDELGMDWLGVPHNDINTTLKALKEFKKEFGHDSIPCQYINSDGIKIGAWLCTVRMECRKGTLSERKKWILERAGFTIHEYTQEWYSLYLKAKEYYDQNGHMRVSIGGEWNKEKARLWQWVSAQRRMYNRPGHGNFSSEQVELLEKIGIRESARIEHDFERGLEEFSLYAEEHQDCLVPISYVSESGFKLGQWICNQRSAYQAGTMKEDHYKRLNGTGMIWENNERVKAERYWDDMYHEAKKYAAQYGSLATLPAGYVTLDGKKLSQWVYQQRRIRRGSLKHSVELTEERIRKLDEIGMSWGNQAE